MNDLLKQFYDAGWEAVTFQEFKHAQRRLVLFREDGQWFQTDDRLRYSKVRGRGAQKSYTLRAAIEKALAKKTEARA